MADAANLGTSATAKIDVETPWGQWRQVPVPLRGDHQAGNAALAVATAGLLAKTRLRIPAQAIYDGMAAVRWPARIEVVSQSPWVVVDAAHNWASTEALGADARIAVFGPAADPHLCRDERQRRGGAFETSAPAV